MPFCEKCGAELKEDEKFCSRCGTPVGAGGETARPRPKYAQQREACFGPPGSGGGMWGAISFGVFLLGVAILLLLNILWPGILILIGLMIIMGAVVAYSRR